VAGWLFVSPALLVLLLFLVVPILLALYVSFTNWDGLSNPLSGQASWVGAKNYDRLISGSGGLTHTNFMTSIRNNFYFVLFTVPLQTALALGLAILVNNRRLKGKGFFRTAFYFPSITSSIAITVVFIFLFQGSGAVN
jgi:multiple sugar transport system permease protein